MLGAIMDSSESCRNWPRTVHVAIFLESIPAKWESYTLGDIIKAVNARFPAALNESEMASQRMLWQNWQDFLTGPHFIMHTPFVLKEQ